MISGVRYRCATCNDFDYCGVCIGFAPFEHGHRFDAIINERTRIYRSSDAWRATGQALPPGVHADDQHKARCDICRTYPIVGTRFKCAECPDWDSCQNCLERSSQFHPEHTFIRVTNQGVLMRVSISFTRRERTNDGFRSYTVTEGYCALAFYRVKASM